MNRGFRIQYSSALGPYEGGLHFGGGMSSDVCKVGVLGFAAIILVLIYFVVCAILDTMSRNIYVHAPSFDNAKLLSTVCPVVA